MVNGNKHHNVQPELNGHSNDNRINATNQTCLPSNAAANGAGRDANSSSPAVSDADLADLVGMTEQQTSATSRPAQPASVSHSPPVQPTPADILQWLEYPQVRQAIFALVAEEAMRSGSPLGRAVGIRPQRIVFRKPRKTQHFDVFLFFSRSICEYRLLEVISSPRRLHDYSTFTCVVPANCRLFQFRCVWCQSLERFLLQAFSRPDWSLA